MAVIPRPLRLELARLRRRDNWRNVLYLGFDWAVIAGSIAAAHAVVGPVARPTAYLIAVVVIGSRQRALMNLVHQASHRKLFANRRANDWAGRLLAAFPLLGSLEAYVCAHCRHHGYLWDPEKDPKVRMYGRLGLIEPAVQLRAFARLHVLRPIMLMHVPSNVVRFASGDGEPRRERLARVAFWACALAGIIGTGHAAELLRYWVVPYVTVFQVIRYWAEMAEHAGLASDDPWMATRSWTSHPLVEWLVAPHSDGFHLAHHLFPAIPHYRLAAAHRLLMQVPEYAMGHHCEGLFRRRRPDAPSVFDDIRRPEQLHGYRKVQSDQVIASRAPEDRRIRVA
jgi:fatty acid desaturase